MSQFSESHSAIFAAFAKAQGELSNIPKDVTYTAGPLRGKRYTSMAATLAAVRPVFAEHKLFVSQSLEGDGDGWLVVTTLIGHESGEWMRSTIKVSTTVGMSQKGVQAVGSAATYARRYALQAVLGIAPGDDDDGAAASQEPPRQDNCRQPPAPERTEAPKPTPPHESWADAAADFKALLEEYGIDAKHLVAYQKSRRQPAPHHMTQPVREQFSGWLQSQGADGKTGADVVKAWKP